MRCKILNKGGKEEKEKKKKETNDHAPALFPLPPINDFIFY